ncbi:ATP-binding cassette domain-containing protein [Zunongwangia sp. H14]|uniref:ATP-binding cassette domain-containing protein n=1 Tax=Zunongwangia sp. H14 TaxID=3240792 RepID=UPI0035641ADD
MKHYAIYVKGFSENDEWLNKLIEKETVPELIGFKEKSGAVFSEKVLEKFIEEDQRRDYSELVGETGRSLRTFSSGEKRKALLNYLLKQNPDYLILDSIFDTLDRQSVEDLKIRLREISKEIFIIQLFRRKEDLFAFIDKILLFENDKQYKSFSAEAFLARDFFAGNIRKSQTIPAAPVAFHDFPETLVNLKNVSVNYEGRPILNNISWKVEKGEFWELTGPNGSGKTTILSMIYGDNPKAFVEEVFLFGKRKGSGESVWEIKNKIGYFSPAITELFHRRNTAQEMLVSGLVDSIGLYQKPTAGQLTLAGKWLKVIGLEHRKNHIFTKLSLPEQRLLLIARAMIKHPPLLILDEPTTALDEKSALKVCGLINKISAQSETAVIFVSHRREKGLKPEKVYELVPAENGSEGRAH